MKTKSVYIDIISKCKPTAQVAIIPCQCKRTEHTKGLAKEKGVNEDSNCGIVIMTSFVVSACPQISNHSLLIGVTLTNVNHGSLESKGLMKERNEQHTSPPRLSLAHTHTL